MKRNAVIAVLCASFFLSGCAKDIKKPQPYGDWQDANTNVNSNIKGK
ncbi:hypothetical protein [Pantoea ananatis]|nr:hypothetical protein [Pantoea ananatis]MCW0309913.1 hypothetical protein [Pantoea ananatis]MCW0341605.1 hypothetical protein [Pantoea ananatis]MCW0360105.1 hypothetical protein [Pantoea ananatis]MCW0364768.1 hypothetical protein [Pantoea ananatis]MCW1777353.1 hypothetical protein [Pantoea ananatis]